MQRVFFFALLGDLGCKVHAPVDLRGRRGALSDELVDLGELLLLLFGERALLELHKGGLGEACGS